MADVKDILYSVIDAIGREKIRVEVSSNIDTASRTYCKQIVENCVKEMGPGASEEELGTLCEALLHFMLTASLLPSERKVTVGGVDLDVVIPSTKRLARNPDKTLVIQVIKTTDDRERVAQAGQVQPSSDNIWTVSAKSVQIGARNYSLAGDKFYYVSLIVDIHTFLIDKGISSLKLLH
ncbi:MAG: hypothetical protein ABI347_06585 [Nitrososphaera sp.]